MKKNVLRVKYEGHEVNITKGQFSLETGCQFQLEYDSGVPVIPDGLGTGFVSAWACVYSSKQSADAIFKRMFEVSADEAFAIDFAKNPGIALITLT